MGVYVIKMPDIGEGIAEVELVEWHVKEGDAVVEDQVLADVMTDKATVQVPSPVHGKVLALGGRVGEVMPVGSALIRLEVEGPGNAAAEAEDAPGARADAAPEESAASGTAAQEEAHAASASALVARAEPASSLAAAAGAHGRASLASVSSAPAPVATARPAARRGRPLASPAVRRRALEEGIDLRALTGTGPVGQVTHDDLDRWLQQGAAAPVARGTAGSGAYLGLAPREGVEEIPVVGLRRKIAQKMQESKRHIPHFTYVEEL